jgi:hypothetical protein
MNNLIRALVSGLELILLTVICFVSYLLYQDIRRSKWVDFDLCQSDELIIYVGLYMAVVVMLISFFT